MKSIHSQIKNPLGKLIWDLFLITGSIFGIFYNWKINYWVVYLLFFCLGALCYWTTVEDFPLYLKYKYENHGTTKQRTKAR